MPSSQAAAPRRNPSSASRPARSRSDEPGAGSPILAAVLAWVVPGVGHVYLGRRARGVTFFALVLMSLLIGCALQGNLYSGLRGGPLGTLATLACMGMGAPYFVVRHLVGYSGEILSAGWEYGSAFILSAGLMNLLLILDAWDIGRGVKE